MGSPIPHGTETADVIWCHDGSFCIRRKLPMLSTGFWVNEITQYLEAKTGVWWTVAEGSPIPNWCVFRAYQAPGEPPNA